MRVDGNHHEAENRIVILLFHRILPQTWNHHGDENRIVILLYNRILPEKQGKQQCTNIRVD